MGRPIKQGLDYFPHDTDASSDEKLESLRALYRNDGYAFYFIILERIYRSNNGELNLSSDEEKKILAKKIGITLKRYETILKSCFKINLFDEKKFSKNGLLTSSGIQKRFVQIQAERQRKREHYEKKKGVLDVQKGGRNNGETTGEMGGETPQSKVKKSIIIELAKSLITDLKKEHSLYSTIGKYKKILGEERLTTILNDCENRGNSFADENKLAAYLETCTRKNGTHQEFNFSFNPIEVK
ncbi:MAG: DUF4373 domain-containing protein [Chitinophagales bacterium]|nr:DUF4373 domain-containing protein [Chitinophagales bacterium]